MARMPTGWRDLTDAVDWFRDNEKQMIREQRHRTHRTSVDASSVQGEAARIIDWNDVTATYNGWYYTEVVPSVAAVPAQDNNSPDRAKAWLGQTRVDAHGYGVQYLSSYQTDPPVEFLRRFSTEVYPGEEEEQNEIIREQVVYGPWEAAGGSGGGGGGSPTGPAGGDLTGTYPDPQIAAGVVGAPELADGAVTTAKIADGTIVIADLAPATVSGLMVDVSDEGSSVYPDAPVLDFVGAGVSVAQVDGRAVVTVPGASSGTVAPVVLRVHRAANQTLAEGGVYVTFDTVAHDVGSGFTYSLPSNVITVAEAGNYIVLAGITWAGNNTGTRVLEIHKSGVLNARSRNNPPASASVGTAQIVSTEMQLAAGDTVQLYGNQNTGSGLAISGGSNLVWLAIVKQGGAKGDKGDTGSTGLVKVNHGTNGATARPAGVPLVYWVGTATPANALPDDFWLEA